MATIRRKCGLSTSSRQSVRSSRWIHAIAMAETFMKVREIAKLVVLPSRAPYKKEDYSEEITDLQEVFSPLYLSCFDYNCIAQGKNKNI